MKPMVYMTNKGFAEISGHRNGMEISGYFIKYDNGNELEVKDDDAFVNWTIRENATYIGTCWKNERINYEKYRCVIEHQELRRKLAQ